MTEKSRDNKYIILKRTKDIKMITIKKKISIIISVITSIFLAYATSCIVSLKFNILDWIFAERLTLLILSLVGIYPIISYCNSHVNSSSVHNDFTILYLSENWFKKLLSIYIYYVFTVFVFYIIFCFCSMSFDISKINYIIRNICAVFICIISVALCVNTHNNNITLILKIDKQ